MGIVRAVPDPSSPLGNVISQRSVRRGCGASRAGRPRPPFAKKAPDPSSSVRNSQRKERRSMMPKGPRRRTGLPTIFRATLIPLAVALVVALAPPASASAAAARMGASVDPGRIAAAIFSAATLRYGMNAGTTPGSRSRQPRNGRVAPYGTLLEAMPDRAPAGRPPVTPARAWRRKPE
jgi:hypothetical protein